MQGLLAQSSMFTSHTGPAQPGWQEQVYEAIPSCKARAHYYTHTESLNILITASNLA